MSERNTSSSSGGIGFIGLLTILFIGLKLTGYIDWSWWWVLSPLWISAILAIVILLIALLVIVLDKRRERRDPMYAVSRSAERLSNALRKQGR